MESRFLPSMVKLVALALFMAQLPWGALALRKVLKLTGDNFEEIVKKNELVMVEFYADWCDDCKVFKPKYEKSFQQVQEEGIKILMAKVDIEDKRNDFLRKHVGQEIPHMVTFRRGNLADPHHYEGANEVDPLVKYIREHAKPISTQLKPEDIPQILEKEKALAVGVFGKLGKSAEFQAYKDVVEKLRNVMKFRHTTNASLLPSEHPTPGSLPLVRVLTSFGEGYFDTKVFAKEALEKFVLQKSLPSVVNYLITEEDVPSVGRAVTVKGRKCWLVFDQNGTDADAFRQAITKTAESHPDSDITFMVANLAQEEVASIFQMFDMEGQKKPSILLLSRGENSKFYRIGITPADVEDFVLSFLSGKEENKIKSEPVPASDEGPAKTLVATQFKEFVVDSGKNVFIMFYDPHCHHCQDTLPIFKGVAEELKDDPDLAFGLMDMTKNDLLVDGFDVDGYPTLYFYTSTGDKLKYNGRRTQKDMVFLLLRHKQPTKYTNFNEFWEDEDMEYLGQDPGVTLSSATDSQSAKDEL